MFKKLLSLALAALMLVGVLASCALPNADGSNTTANPNSSQDTTMEETLDIPDTRYDDTELCFLTRDESEWSTIEIFAEEMTSNTDNINNAVYERNDRILQDYGVTITELKKPTGEHYTSVTTEVSAPTGDFHVIVTNAYYSADMATNSFLWDLNSDYVEYMDLTKPWWDTNLAEGLSIEEKLYFATGDLMTLDNDATFCILFNKQIVKDCNIEDLYALVQNNQWTMDKMYEFSQTAKQDKDGDGKLSWDKDVAGLAYTVDGPYCLMFGGGITMCTKDENDSPIYDLDVERAQDIAEKGQLVFSKDYSVDLNAAQSSSGITMVEVGQKAFGEGHALFMGEVMQCVTRLRGFDVDFGILPWPMYDANQGNYYSMMHATASMVSIPKSVGEDDLVRVESMLEAMSYHSVNTLTKEYYEINLKTKGAKDEQSGPMIDKILASRSCDLAYYYKWGSNAFGSLANAALPGSGTSVASMATKQKKAVENSIRQLLRKMNKDS